MKRFLLLLFTVLSLSANSSAVVQSQTQNFLPPSSKNIDISTKDTGVILAVVGISFMIIDILVSGFSILGIGGVLFFIFGSVLFFNVDLLYESSLMSLVIAFRIVTVGFIILALRQFVSSKSAKIVTGSEDIIGSFAKVVEVNEEGAHVLCHGEIWSATSKSELVVGQEVEVIELLGLELSVQPIKE
jgi:membrane-bound serine protease (ClpP class)